jgi:hypothetical protein
MTLVEHTPFHQLHRKLVEHDQRGTAPDSSRGKKLVQSIPRCQTVVDAKGKHASNEDYRAFEAGRRQAMSGPARLHRSSDDFQKTIDMLEKADSEKIRQTALKHTRTLLAERNADAMDREKNDASKVVEEIGAQKVAKFNDNDDDDNNNNNRKHDAAVSPAVPVASLETMSTAARWYENHTAFDEEKAQHDGARKKNSGSVQDNDGDENMFDF